MNKRRAIALDVLAALQFLSEDLSATTVELSDRAERDAPDEKKGGAACAPSNGMKGHGIANVPGAWYDVAGHIDGARAVISTAADYFGSLQGAPYDAANHVASLIEAASELLRLAVQDVDRLEQELKAVAPGGAPERRSTQQE